MKWHKFLIYFSLWAGAVLNLVAGIRCINTARAYAGVQGAGKVLVIGVCCVALSVLGVITRFRLANFRKDGPTLLAVLYGATLIVNLIGGASWASIIASAVMVVINAIYYSNRKEMFTE